jgi:hypothetical protein
MACELVAEDCEFTGSGDKGVSVGERTRVSLRNCRFLDCDIGLEVKDDSRALVEDSTFRGNRVAVHSYQKKWLYGRGGSTALAHCTLEGSRQADYLIEKRCELLLLGTPSGKVGEGDRRIRRVETLAEEWRPLLARAE